MAANTEKNIPLFGFLKAVLSVGLAGYIIFWVIPSNIEKYPPEDLRIFLTETCEVHGTRMGMSVKAFPAVPQASPSNGSARNSHHVHQPSFLNFDAWSPEMNRTWVWSCFSCAHEALDSDQAGRDSVPMSDAPTDDFEKRRCRIHDTWMTPVAALKSGEQNGWLRDQEARKNYPNAGSIGYSDSVVPVEGSDLAWYATCLSCEGEAILQFMNAYAYQD